MKKGEIRKASNPQSPSHPRGAENNQEMVLPILGHMHFIDIHQVQFNAIRTPIFDQRPDDAEFSIESNESVEVAYHSEKHGVVAVVSLGIEASDTSGVLFKISAVYRAIYSVKDSYKGDLIEERAKAFCKSTTLAHVWPYWREALGTTCLKMGLPPILAPLLIVGAKP